MVILRSDFSPQAAQSLQEADNALMLEMLLRFSGLTEEDVKSYIDDAALAAQLFEEALGESDELGNHTDEQWDEAMEATEAPLAVTSAMLSSKGVTIENVLLKSEDQNMFSCIQTTVYNGFTNMTPVAQIERPIPDIEAETYADNHTGYGADNPEQMATAQQPSEQVH